jgi:hypothetical protein
MTKENSNNQKKGKPKMFLLFLLISTFIWFLSKFSRDFVATIDVGIEYRNTPHGIFIADENKNIISFDLTASGFDFLYYKINRPKIFIDLRKYYNYDKSFILIPPEDFKRIIANQLQSGIIIKNISTNKLEILLDKLETKRVKVTLIEDISYIDGYKAVGAIKIIPDSIEVSGPAHQLDTLNEIFTNLLSIPNVSKNISTKVSLNTSFEKKLSFEKNEVNINIEVKEFTQKSILIPLTLKNPPPNLNIKLLPESIIIDFDVSLESFNKIKISDFLIEIDYHSKNELKNYMIPKLIKFPDSILNVEIRQDKVNYLILK